MKQYIDPFIQVCTTVFKDMLNCTAIPDRAYFTGKETFLNWDISGIIALTGEVRGMVAISMKYPTASKITGILLKTSETISSPDMVDAVGELVNIITGNVKKKLEDMFRISISLPKVVYGKAHSIVIPDERTRMLCIPFSIFDTETICLSINISET
ncbi:MAG: chemotaxis protein CheX [Spirochaetaceae bacterium]|jgi:chemotaxis protein CheX|nr:chemotaxis protein CheX [Spirochaetaceae bacterium]